MQVTRRDLLRFALGGTLLRMPLGLKPGQLQAREPDGSGIAPVGDSPFLQGNFGPVREESTVDELKIVGQLPRELRGMFVRNGPNPRFAPLGKYHWFDGDGMLHGVRIRDGKASYRNRFIQTAGYKAEAAAGKALWSGLAATPDFTQVTKGQPLFKNAANTALVWHDGKLLALWEGGEPYHVRVPGLETVGPYTFDKRLRHACTAHPKVDAETGEMMLFGYSAMAPVVHYSTANADGELTRTVPIPLRKPVMMHDFAVTRRYSIFMDLPVTFDIATLAKSGSMMRFDRELGSRFGILPRHGVAQDIRWFESPSCYVFHTLNAWDEGDTVTLVACRMPEFADHAGGQTPSSDNPFGTLTTVLYRWQFNLATGAVTEGPIDDVHADFPRVNDARLGRRTRFGYTMSLEMGGLVKTDLERGGSCRHSFGAGRLGGEGVFVARPGAQGEDDGWLVTYVFDTGNRTSELLVIDARDFAASPVARVLIPARVPYGFHGIWLDDAQLST